MKWSKSWLIVKSEALADETKRVFGDEVNITTEGQCYLGAVIASQEYKDQYCEEKDRVWKEEIERLSQRPGLTQRTLPSQKGTSQSSPTSCAL